MSTLAHPTSTPQRELLQASGARHRSFPVTSHLPLFHRIPSCPLQVSPCAWLPLPSSRPVSGRRCALSLLGARHRRFPVTSSLTPFHRIPSRRPQVSPCAWLPLPFTSGLSHRHVKSCASSLLPPCVRNLHLRSPVVSVLLSGGPAFLPVVSLPDPVPVGSATVGEGSLCRCRECVIAAVR